MIEIQRVKKERIPSVTKAKKIPINFKYPSSLSPPPVPEGEDDHSFARHNKMLIAEFKKKRPNSMVVNDMMILTFPMRRSDIVQYSHKYKLKDLFEKYPFLQTEDQVYVID